jgi:hypothetical protein
MASEPQLRAALAVVREHPSSTARNLSARIRGAGGHAVTPERAGGLLRELEKRGLVRRWKRPGTRAYLWEVTDLA